MSVCVIIPSQNVVSYNETILRVSDSSYSFEDEFKVEIVSRFWSWTNGDRNRNRCFTVLDFIEDPRI